MNIDEAFEYAAVLHGHKCPGLAIGVRAAEEAKRILEIDDIQDKEFYCVAENQACYIDGIQALAGCTLGKGNLIIHPIGKTAFSFCHTGKGRSIRMMLKQIGQFADRSAKIDFLLHAPLDEVFSLGEAHCVLPKRKPKSGNVHCSVCGESVDEYFIKYRSDKPVCADCAEKAEL